MSPPGSAAEPAAMHTYIVSRCPRERTGLWPREPTHQGTRCWLSCRLGSFTSPNDHSGLPKHPYKYNTIPRSDYKQHTACALQLVLPLRSLPACVQDTAGVVHCSYPATAQCNDNTFIYQSEMRLQEVAPKAPFILGPA